MAAISMRGIYNELKAIQALAWQNDDYMSQETLYKLQDALAVLALNVALRCGEGEDLVATFPWLYHTSTDGK